MSVLGATLMGASDLRAAGPPLFSSGPAILATSVSPTSLDLSTKIIGFAPHGTDLGAVIVSSDNCTSPNWWKTICDGFFIPGLDGDPAAAYSKTDFSQFWICGHSGSTGYIYCQRGSVTPAQTCANPPDLTRPPLYQNGEGGSLGQVGTKIFNPSSSPALVRVLNVQGLWLVWLFAQGSNGQIWSSARFDGAQSWGNWSQLPTFPGGFSSPPGAAGYASGRIIVCARQPSNNKYACTHQEFGFGGSLVWSTWTEVPGNFQYGTKPALTTSNSSVYLFGNDIGGSKSEIARFLPIGGGTWSAESVVGAGTGFLSGPAVIAISYGTGIGPTVLTVGRGSDSAFWWDNGSSGGWNSNWNQIQVINNF